MTDKEHFEEMAHWAEEIDPETIPLTDMSAEDHASMVDAIIQSDDPAIKEAVRASSGRPGLDANASGPSPLWTIRAPASLDTQMRAIADEEGWKFSDVVRRAAIEFVERRGKDMAGTQS